MPVSILSKATGSTQNPEERQKPHRFSAQSRRYPKADKERRMQHQVAQLAPRKLTPVNALLSYFHLLKHRQDEGEDANYLQQLPSKILFCSLIHSSLFIWFIWPSFSHWRAEAVLTALKLFRRFYRKWRQRL